MNQFQERAGQLLDVARQVSGERSADSPPANVAVLINHAGAVTIVQDPDRPLAAIQDEYGACVAYRVCENGDGGISVTGRTGGQTFSLANGAANPAQTLLPPEIPKYLLK